MNNKFVFCFEFSNSNKLLANVINIGTYTNPDIKLSFGKKVGIVFGEAGINYDNIEDEHTFTSNNVEFSYHNDGSYLRKLPQNPNPYKYFNPGGQGTRYNPLDEINSILCLAIIEVQNYIICDDYFAGKGSLFVNIKEDNLLNGEPFKAIIFVKNKLFPINKLSCEIFYSNYVELSSKLDLGIYLQRVEKKHSQRIYSKALNSYINTTVGNTISFCKNDENIIPFVSMVTDKSLFDDARRKGVNDIIYLKWK